MTSSMATTSLSVRKISCQVSATLPKDTRSDTRIDTYITFHTLTGHIPAVGQSDLHAQMERKYGF